MPGDWISVCVADFFYFMQQCLEPWRDERQALVSILSSLGGTLLTQQTLIITKSPRENISRFLYNTNLSTA